DETLEVVLGADRKLDRDRLGAEAVDDVGKALEEVGAGLVHLVCGDDARNLVLVALAPDGLGLRLDALVAIEHANGAGEHAQRTLDLDGEVDVAGGVDDVQTLAVPERGGRSRGDRDATLLLLLHPVHRRGTFVHFADLVALAGVIEDALGRRGLTGIDMRHDTEVTVVLDGMLAGHGVASLGNPDVSPLPAIVREGAVGFRHAMHVFTLLDGVPPVVRRVQQLGREPLRHRLLIALARGRNDPANAERLPTHRANFHRHLVSGAADAAGTHLDRRHDVLERLHEDRQRVLLGLGLDHAERAVDDAFGNRLLSGIHHRVHELGDDDVSELRVRKHLTLFGGMATRHLLFSLVPRGLFGTLGAVFRPALLTVLDALGVQHAAENVVAHAGQVLDAAAADHDHRVLLQVMALAGDVADHLEAVGQAHLGDLAKRR